MIHNTSGVERTELSKLKIGDYIKMQIIKDKNGIYTLIGKDETEEGSHSFGVFDFIKYKRGKLVSDGAIDGDGRGTLTLGFTFDNRNNIFPTGLLYGDRQLRILSHSEMIDLDTYTFNDMIDKRFFLVSLMGVSQYKNLIIIINFIRVIIYLILVDGILIFQVQ